MYDCTHDNPSPLEKFKTARIALSHLGVAAMADIPIASTWGYDQLIPKNIDVVKEKRLYFKFD
jgi:glycogen debranching enzyme